MDISIAVLTIIITALMTCKLLRTLQERSAKKKGFITFGGDDKYQLKKFYKNIHSTTMVARVSVDFSEHAFQEVIERTKDKYLTWHQQLCQSIDPIYLQNDIEPPFEVWEKSREYRPSTKLLLTKIIACKKEKTFLLAGNHTFLGGYLLSQFVQLLFCDKQYTGVFPKNRYFPFITELSIVVFLVQIFARRRRKPVAMLFENHSDIRRLQMKTAIDTLYQEANHYKIHHLYLVIAKHVLLVMKYLNTNRLRVTLPISFEDDSSFNTIGAMFLDVSEQCNLQQMAITIRKKIKQRKYQVSASNHIQRIFPTRHLSEKARNTVDLTLTVVPQKTLPNNLIGKEMKSYEFTMQSITYPVYIMSFIFENYIHSSFMINTPHFDCDAAVAGNKDVEFLDLNV